jgi:hypothetical protein
MRVYAVSVIADLNTLCVVVIGGTSRPWLVYWILHALSLLDIIDLLPEKTVTRCVHERADAEDQSVRVNVMLERCEYTHNRVVFQ